MRSLRHTIRSQRWLPLAALAIFLGGTNYCVAVAFAGPGSKLSCVMSVASTDGASDESLPPCHRRAAKADAGHAPATPMPSGPMPCCITLAPASVAPDAKPAVEIVMALPPGVTFEAVSEEWSEAPLILDTGPPEARTPSSHSSRAPPLAW